jgi:predicted esterase
VNGWRQLSCLLLVLIPVSIAPAFAADDPAVIANPKILEKHFVDRVFHDEAGDHKYEVFLPTGYTTDRKWPVVLFLHGAGERGNDGHRQAHVGLGAVLTAHPELLPAIVVFPQAEETRERILTEWSPERSDGERALKILEDVEANYSIDTKQRILTGWSMGGFGAWQLAAASKPGFWKSMLSLSGGCSADVATKVPHELPIWAIHGAEDRIIAPAEMTVAVAAARAAGHAVESTIINGVGHDIWKVVYSRPEVIAWMLDPKSVKPESVTWSDEQVEQLTAENPPVPEPFVPGAIISRAVAVRIGNDAFDAIAQGLPSSISKDKLQGDVSDIIQTTDYNGTSIRAAITGIRWTMELDSVSVEAQTAERLVVRVGLKNLVLRVTESEIKGGQYHAHTGPFEIQIGRRQPVFVRFTAQPSVVDHAIRLNEKEIQFSIPDWNWFISEPKEVSAKGPGLTPDLVRIGLVGGLYRKRSEVEKSVRELIPPLIRRIEERLVLSPPDSVASLLWPLPTPAPQLHLQPEAMRTDSGGVSLTVATIISAVDPSHPAPPTTQTSPAPIDEDGGRGVRIGIAVDAMSALAESFKQSDDVRLDVLDAPEHRFDRLADVDLLQQSIPDITRLASDHEIRTEFVLEEAFRLKALPAVEDRANGIRVQIIAPKAALVVSSRPNGSHEEWNPFARFPMSIDHALIVTLGDATTDTRSIDVRWDDQFKIEGSIAFAEGARPVNRQLNADPVLNAFRDSWANWTKSFTRTSSMKDLVIGDTHLRLHSLPVRGDRVWLQFQATREKPSVETAEAERGD